VSLRNLSPAFAARRVGLPVAGVAAQLGAGKPDQDPARLASIRLRIARHPQRANALLMRLPDDFQRFAAILQPMPGERLIVHEATGTAIQHIL
jgi:hypothetical protein